MLPAVATDVLDVGAGSGVDAAWFASLGHTVVAVEPTRALREHAVRLHSSPRIEWLDDCLPQLSSIVGRGGVFGLIVACAVWTHLSPDERPLALRALRSLLAKDGTLVLSLRHGPSPEGRASFPASARDTVASAAECGLSLRFQGEADSLQPQNRAAAVRWTWLAFGRAA